MPTQHPHKTQGVRRRELLHAGLATGVTPSTWPLSRPSTLWGAEVGQPKRGGILRVRGSTIELERNPAYWKPGLPYLDGIKYFIITDTSARAKAIRSGRVDVELRFLPPAETDAIKEQLGDKVVVDVLRSIGNFGITINVDKKP